MKPIAWICLAATAVVAGTVPASARACSPSYDLIDEVTFDGAVPDCLDIGANWDDEDQDDYDGNYVLVVLVDESCEHEVESETSWTDPDTGVTSLKIQTATMLSEHFGEELEVPVMWTINGITESTTMIVTVVEDDPLDQGDPGYGCGCSVSTHAPPSILWFGLLGLGFIRGRGRYGERTSLAVVYWLSQFLQPRGLSDRSFPSSAGTTPGP